ncbi:ferritin-like domain-containing protein [Sphingomonas sp. CROZ-RG-20F-R02-07]|uniref:ferritin-like domain-containing protein n=1 Tax=Sphingomonas sp. CROZ-RG-20F-R02-07 TaxID=2914832 RepID=UPI001F5ADB18|nr:ferritin-like domain-containing protein [Sphingomonas sp. CROZ-RG-20F-R02-07]
MPYASPLRLDAADRRGFLRLAAGFAGTVLLSGCGGGDASSDPVPVVSSGAGSTPPTTSESTPLSLTPEAVSLNLALNLEYLCAQYYSYAVNGTGLASDMVAGIGAQGRVLGGRQASLANTLVAQHAAESATDKLATVVALRGRLGTSAAAQPTIDFTATATSAFSVAAQAAGLVASGVAFDPFASDANFLLSAFLLENAVAATYRREMATMAAGDALQTMTDNLGGAIYHGGLVRTLLSAQANGDAALTLSYTALSAYTAKLDGTDTGDQTLAGTNGDSANIVDSDGHAIPFLRTPTQALNLVYLNRSASTAGGFLPSGTNGVRV